MSIFWREGRQLFLSVRGLMSGATLLGNSIAGFDPVELHPRLIYRVELVARLAGAEHVNSSMHYYIAAKYFEWERPASSADKDLPLTSPDILPAESCQVCQAKAS